MNNFIYLNDHLYNIFDITSISLNRKALRIEIGIRNSNGIYKEAVMYEDTYEYSKTFEENLIWKEWQVLLEKFNKKEGDTNEKNDLY